MMLSSFKSASVQMCDHIISEVDESCTSPHLHKCTYLISTSLTFRHNKYCSVQRQRHLYNPPIPHGLCPAPSNAMLAQERQIQHNDISRKEILAVLQPTHIKSAFLGHLAEF